MTASIGDLPGDTKPFDFASSHCTMLQMDNKVIIDLHWNHVLIVVVVIVVLSVDIIDIN